MRRVAVVIGSGQETGGSAAALPKSDRAAIGLALTRFDGQVVAYCLPDDDTARRYALAAGAEAATCPEDVAMIDFDVALVGSGGAEPWGDVLLARLAECKPCAMVFDVLDLEPRRDGMRVRRDLGRGSREILGIDGPAVLGISEDAVQLLYVSRYRRQAVRVSPPAPSARSEGNLLAAVSGAWEPVRPRVKTAHLAARTSGSAGVRRLALLGLGGERRDDSAQVVVADAKTCAQHLLRFLSHHGFIAGPVSVSTGRLDSASDLPRQTSQPSPDVDENAAVPVRPPLLRGPRPLAGAGHGMERRPRPLQADLGASAPNRAGKRRRGPRPVGQPAPQQDRGPRPVA